MPRNARARIGSALLAAAFVPALVSAAEWREHLVTAADIESVSVGERTVMAYHGTGAGLLVHESKNAPLGSYECAGMVDQSPDGASLDIACVVTDANGHQAYLTVRRDKSDTFAAGTGIYTYDGGTGPWADFRARCSYEVAYMPDKVHGVEQASCEGDALPPPLR